MPSRPMLGLRMTCAVIVVLACTACATRPTGPEPGRESSTRITEGGLKFFIYRWHWKAEESFGKVNVEGLAQTNGSHFEPGAFYYREEDFVEEVEEWLDQTGYCREGYFELSRYYDVAGARLRGECKELASDEDRDRFGEAQSPDTSANTSSAG